MANYILQSHRLSGNSDQERAKALFDAIRCLDVGFFADHVGELSRELHALFDDVPATKDGKQLGELTYKSCGLICDKEDHALPMPPFETEPEDGNADAEDAKKRIKAIERCCRWYFHKGDTTLKQIAWSMSGRQPRTRNGVVGKSLYKITRLVDKMEKASSENPGIDMELAFYGAYSKIYAEACGPISVGDHENNYDRNFRNDGTLAKGYGHTVYLITCTHGDLTDQVASTLSKGALSNDRIYQATHGLRSENVKETAGFVPMTSIVDIHEYIDSERLVEQLVDGIARDCPELQAAKTEREKEREHRHAVNYLSDMLRPTAWCIQAIYDAVQAYYAYDGIRNERTRDFLLDAGYIIKDWHPDPELWYRASKYMFPSREGRSQYAKTLPEDVKRSHRDMCYAFLQEQCERLHGRLSDGDVADRQKKLLPK